MSGAQDADVCVVGGGPAGLIAALLLARGGVRVTVLEKHADFLRDFRGDTVHPSTLLLLDQIGLGPAVHALPHRQAQRLRVSFDGDTYTLADFSRLRGRYPYLMFLPQWDLLDLLAATAQGYPGFTLLRSTEVTGVLTDGGRVVGVRAHGPDGEVQVRARLTIAADGRGSAVRDSLGLVPVEYSAPMDVLWFRLPRHGDENEGLTMRVGPGGLLITIDRGSYWQVAYVITKGGRDVVLAAGLPALRDRVAALAPPLAERVMQLSDVDEVKTLTVRVNRLRRWHAAGVLLIGDAAHAMSPIGGVGINLAVQDAVAAARILLPALRAGTLSTKDLARVRARRYLPTALTQLVQRVVQRGFVAQILHTSGPVRAPRALRLLRLFPALQVLPARVFGLGIRREQPPGREQPPTS